MLTPTNFTNDICWDLFSKMNAKLINNCGMY